jgi:DNA-nicking Smr family endonuclease
MAKKSSISDEEKAQFRNSVKGIKPLAHDKTALFKTAKIKKIITYQHHEAIHYYPIDEITNINADDSLIFIRAGLQDKITRQLKRGHFPIEARLDLHGLTSPQAYNYIQEFIMQAREHHFRHVLIIHGKGRVSTPILKNKVNNWLRQHEHVLAFSSAKPQHGGTGAMYVLLKLATSF